MRHSTFTSSTSLIALWPHHAISGYHCCCAGSLDLDGLHFEHRHARLELRHLARQPNRFILFVLKVITGRPISAAHLKI